MADATSLFAEAQTLHRAGHLPQAGEFYREVLRTAPRHGGALHMLGVIAFQSGDAAQAAALLQQAAAIDPDVPALRANLGLAQAAMDRLENAAASFAAALALNPALEQARTGLGDACNVLAARALKAGDAVTALARVRQSLAAAETGTARRLFASIVQALHWPAADAGFRGLLIRALDENWGPPGALAPMAAELVLRGGTGDGLTPALLLATPNSDARPERLLTEARRALLAKPDAEGGIPPLWVIAAACYFPLSQVSGAEKLRLRAWPEAVRALMAQQLEESAEEKRLTAALPALTPISDDVSQQVRRQYEESPYPRWVRPAASSEAVTLFAYLKTKFPHAALDGLPEEPDMLIAGCGTGQFALELAGKFRCASMLAVDLSRTSLAYAARKAAEAGTAIAFGQADILRAAALDRQFDVIESSGVLHHLADPLAGWRALLGQLRPGGVMLIGLYSETARRIIVAAREWIAHEGLPATPEGIRACRQRLMAEPDGKLAALLGLPDFYSVSACRDLLFHVQEKRLTLDEIAAFLAAHGLTLLGFEIGDKVLAAYRARFPDDPDAINLAHRRDFEAEHPDTFAAMYQFWVRR